MEKEFKKMYTGNCMEREILKKNCTQKIVWREKDLHMKFSACTNWSDSNNSQNPLVKAS